MAINKAGLELVKFFEGLRLKAYIDPVGVLTIGYGHTGPDVVPGMTITEAKADALLKADLQKHESFVTSKVKVAITANQKAALTSFAFNVGNGNLGASTLLKKLNQNDTAGAADEFLKWVYGTVDGVKVKLAGLVKRRTAERALFLSQAVELEAPKMEVSDSPAPQAAPSSGLGDFAGPAIPIALLGGHAQLVVAIQDALTAKGYLDPPSDGKFGPVTSWALNEFCYANGLSTGAGFTTSIAEALRSPGSELPKIATTGTWFDKVIAYMKARGYWVSRHNECFNIVYLEGVNPDGTLNDDRPNVFNDLRVVFRIDSLGVPQITTWEGTTEPSVYWTKKPMNPGGAARIAFDQYKAWVVGTHLKSKPSSAHEALVQVEPVAVHRDFNKDFARTGDAIDRGLFGINQHWGYDAPKNDLGTTSAGCLVGRSKEGHREFMALLKSDPRYLANSAYRFVAAIMPGDEVLA